MNHEHRAFDFKNLLLATVVAGVLDATDGVVAFGLVNGQNPIQVLQYIASGLLGVASFKGGLATALLGMVLHFFIAFVVAAVFFVAARFLPALRKNAVVFGLIYGALVYLVMNFLVLPLSAVPTGPFSIILFLNGVIGHAVFVGLPIALIEKRSGN